MQGFGRKLRQESHHNDSEIPLVFNFQELLWGFGEEKLAKEIVSQAMPL